MLKRVDEFIIQLSIEEGSYLVDIIELHNDNTYKRVNLHYTGSIRTFKDMSDAHLKSLLKSLIKRTNNSNFRLSKEINYEIN